MKIIAWTLAAALLLAAFGLWPFEAKAVESLLPIQTITVAENGSDVEVFTDNGLYGRGEDYAAAMNALEESAPGTAFFASCSAVVLFRARALLDAVKQDTRLRPAAAVYAADAAYPPDLVQDVLAAHPGSTTISDVRRGLEELPTLEMRNGGWFVDDVS